MAESLRIEVHTKLDYAKYRKFVLFNIFKSRVPKLKFAAVMATLAVMTVVPTVLGIVMSAPTYFVITAMAVAVDLYYMKLICFTPKSLFRSNQRAIEKPGVIVFRREGLSSYEPKSDKLIGTVRYDSVNEIYETADFIYIYLAKGKTLIVDKEGIGEEDRKELSELLKESKGKKYFPVR